MYVEPGPAWPATSPAMTRTSAPPSDVDEQRDLRRPQVLVARRRPLLVARQVHPELDPVEQAAAGDEPLRRLLDVEDAGAGRHPLGVAVRDRAAAAVRVLVLERAVHHVGHGLEAAVRVPRRALRLARRVVDLAHLVHVDERVEVGEVDVGEGAADREALPFQAAPGDRQALDGPLAGDGRIGVRDAGQDGDVVDGDRGHVSRFLAACVRHANSCADSCTVNDLRQR